MSVEHPARRPHLPQVTLLTVTSVALGATLRAVELTMNEVQFGEVLWLSDCPPPFRHNAVRWHKIAPITSLADYSHFMLRKLHLYVKTSHALCIQWDGYVLNAAHWDPAFLDYDYIGAPWPQFADDYRVGNGGFSLRSQKLLAAYATFDCGAMSEDIAICRAFRAELEANFAIRFAPEDVARRFSYERLPSQGNEFGFHGVFNMIARVSARELTTIIEQLELNLLTRNEHKEMIGYALRRRQWRLAWAVWQRLRNRRAH